MRAIQSIVQRKVAVILQRAFIEARNLAMRGASEQIHDLADAFEAIPPLLADWEDERIGNIRDLVGSYQAKHVTAYNYVSILDMSDADFEKVFETTETF